MDSSQQHPRYRKPKVDKELRGVKEASLDLSYEDIVAHCQRTAGTEGNINSCIDLNCYFQKEYVLCFEIYHNKATCVEYLRKDIEQMGGYKFSHVKL
jgi:hypothetical protein